MVDDLAPTHRCLVAVYRHSRLYPAGEALHYDGPATWQFEPINPAARARWRKATADRELVILENWKAAGRSGDPASFDTTTPDLVE